MIGSIIKKQGLIFLRNLQQLLLLVGLPIILIVILGASLSGFMNGEDVSIDAKVAWIEHGDQDGQMERFFVELEKSGMPPKKVTSIRHAAKQMNPIGTLKNDILESDELKGVIKLVNVEPSEKKSVLNNESYAAVIEIPENFTFTTLQHVFLGTDSTSAIKVYENEGKTLGSGIIENILSQYQEQLTMHIFASKNGLEENLLKADANSINGEIVSINRKDPVSAEEYYTVGMAVMNVLFVASAIGSFAFMERQSHVFNRIILANVSRWTYFSGIFVSGVVFAFIHLLIVFGFAWAFYGVVWPDLFGFFTITLGVAASVGGFAVLLTAISYRLRSEQVTNFFSNIIVSIFAFLGGSFFPIGDFVKVIQSIGNFTPNGAGMSAYLQLLRGDSFYQVSDHLIFLVLFAIVLVALAVFSFPKRGQTI